MRGRELAAVAALISAAVLGCGCLDPIEPDVGPLMMTPCVDADSNPDVDVSFANDVRAKVLDWPGIECARCHTPDGETPIGLAATGFDVSTATTLKQGGDNTGAAIVVPGKPCDSLLFEKLGPAPPFGSRMPLSGPPFLTDAELQIVSDWIFEGARDN